MGEQSVKFEQIQKNFMKVVAELQTEREEVKKWKTTCDKQLHIIGSLKSRLNDNNREYTDMKTRLDGAIDTIKKITNVQNNANNASWITLKLDASIRELDEFKASYLENHQKKLDLERKNCEQAQIIKDQQLQIQKFNEFTTKTTIDMETLMTYIKSYEKEQELFKKQTQTTKVMLKTASVAINKYKELYKAKLDETQMLFSHLQLQEQKWHANEATKQNDLDSIKYLKDENNKLITDLKKKTEQCVILESCMVTFSNINVELQEQLDKYIGLIHEGPSLETLPLLPNETEAE